MQQWWWCCSTLGQRWWHYRAVSILLFRTVSGNSPGVQVLSYYTLEVVTGLMTGLEDIRTLRQESVARPRRDPSDGKVVESPSYRIRTRQDR